MDFEFWHPLSFLQRIFNFDLKVWKENLEKKSENLNHGFGLLKMEWDSQFFGAEISKISFLNPEKFNSERFNKYIYKEENGLSKHIFIEVPSEAVGCFGLLSGLGFSLVESRLTYFHLLDHLPTPLNNSRKASKVDIPYLKKVASQAVNDFDRYHADPFFSTGMANNYLETYIENCVNGFSECVFVPDLDQVPYSFVALSRLKEDSWLEKEPLFRIPLTACLPENKGWHYLLCLEALHYAKNNNAKCLVMTTQTTNKAVIHNCEKLGFKLGSCTHIFSKSF